MTETHLEKLPIVYQTRDFGENPLLTIINNERFEGKREDISYFRDAYEDKVYFVICGGKNNTSRFKIKKGDKIIFNGTDENGFDMGIVRDVNYNDLRVEYLEFVGGGVRKCRNLNRLPPPEDFELCYGNSKTKKYNIKFNMDEKREDQKWFLVLHTMTGAEYIDEIVIDGMWEECQCEYELDEIDELDEIPELAINYHCIHCLGDSPLKRERCRRTAENSTIASYEISANDAYNGEGEYANQPTITTWVVKINGDEYLIDYNNVLFSFDGEILGYAIPSRRQGLEGFNEPFDSMLFNDEISQLPPPKYPSPPEYKE